MDTNQAPVVPEQNESWWIRDAEFFFSNGDCSILVENTLFKVHRFLLTRDSQVFDKLLSGGESVQPAAEFAGSVEGVPIIKLQGDTVVEFRALLWILYARPDVTHHAASDVTLVPKVLTISTIAHRYGFKSLESWVASSLLEHMSSKRLTSEVLLSTGQPFDILEKILRVGMDSNVLSLRSLVLLNWLTCLKCHPSLPSSVIDIVDRYDFPEFKGPTYYHFLVGTDQVPPPHVRLLTGDIGLSIAQRTRLLRGFMFLSGLWDSLRTSPPTFSEGEACTHHEERCLPSWNRRWVELVKHDTVLSRCSADVLGKLGEVGSLLMADTFVEAELPSECRNLAFSSLSEAIAQIDQSLAQYFVDLAP
ncbi:hypothetical protein BD410DRAFT_721614 [Rickenella mellea]|uniref:BTB domain-containing protein n=1 Tax=Rickenella mellea TaxID=50990 RepID=A0A4Y7Q684_9AGAM|nr:hypothetical protein BD410DRAFT_721614 [Rickenella mellea]